MADVIAVLIDTVKGLAVLVGCVLALLWAVSFLNAMTDMGGDTPKGWYAVWLFAPLVVIVGVFAWLIGRNI